MKKTDDVARLKKLLYNDYLNIPNSAFSVLKSDIIKLLGSYFDLIDDSVSLKVETDGDGNFTIDVHAEAAHVKELKILN